jgi:hypothetical protein
MAAVGQPLSTGPCAARPTRARRPELARRTGNPFAGPQAAAGPPVMDYTGKHRVRTGRRAGSRDTDEGRQGSDRRLPPARTTQTRVTPGPRPCAVTGAARQPERLQAVPQADPQSLSPDL